jgi:hypothetical protein
MTEEIKNDSINESDFAKIFMGKTIPTKDPNMISVDEHNYEMSQLMAVARATVEASILEERNQCAIIAEQHHSETIAKAIRERIPTQSVHLN